MINSEFTIENKLESDLLTVIIEPWAEEFYLSPGSILLAQITAHVDGQLEIQSSVNMISFWFWETCLVHIKIDGVDKTTPALSILFP